MLVPVPGTNALLAGRPGACGLAARAAAPNTANKVGAIEQQATTRQRIGVPLHKAKLLSGSRKEARRGGEINGS
jgi:hypothetical protein